MHATLWNWKGVAGFFAPDDKRYKVSVVLKGRIHKKDEILDAIRDLAHRIEKGDPGCAIGAVFEVAAIVGVRLFDADQSTLATGIAANTATLAANGSSITVLAPGLAWLAGSPATGVPAVAAGDLERGHNLAEKAHLLSEDLIKP